MAQLEEAGAAMNDCVQLEIAIECGRHSELQAWAERLHTTPEDLALRAIAAWLTEMDEDAQHRE